MKKTRVALIGYGYLGRWHAQKVETLEKSELSFIVERSEGQREIAEKNHPNTKVISDYTEILDQVDAFVIVTPTSTHYPILKSLSPFKHHIFCEKPLTSTYEQSLEILSLSGDASKVFMTGHSERCHEIWNKKDLINKDEKIEFIRVTPFKGRASDVDVLQDLCIHDIDLVNFLFKAKELEIETLELEKTVTEHYDRAKFIIRSEVFSEITILADRNFSEEKRVVNIGESDFINLADQSYRLQASEGVYEKRDHLLIEHTSFYNAISESKEPLASFDDGMKALKVLKAVYESYETKEKVKVLF